MILNHWTKFFRQENISKILLEISENLRKHETKTIFPAKENMFKVFELCDLPDLKVVILGQDPYHGAGQATGLSFSVPENCMLPPSLKNIFKELETDLNIKNTNGDLTPWAKQGVFLLNTALTVNEGEPASHKNVKWEKFTDEVIKYINSEKENIVFILWGNFAISKKKLIDEKKHFIITSPHPSPLSVHRGFYGSKPFSKTNDFLKSKNLKVIDWKID